MTNQPRWWFAAILVGAVLGCGPGTIETLEADEPPGEVVADDGTGEVLLTTPDPSESSCAQEPCEVPPLELEDAGAEEVEVDAGLLVVTADAGAPDAGPPVVTVDAGTPDAGARIDAGINLWAAGARVLVRGYVTFRSAASSTASALTAVEPNGGITDSAHGGGMTRGLVPPGQAVTLVTGTRTNGFYQVRYAALSGWISASWLTPIPASGRAAFAVLPAVRNAFFKHQLHRTRWNKDGPYSSGTCAPTSLAMVVHALGKEPGGKSVEESIHRVRVTYGATTDSTGTRRSQITEAATDLGMSVRVLDTRLTLSDMLTRINTQLGLGRMIVLEGQPADGGAYQAAFNRAYVAASLSNRYTFSGRHSIAVLGRDGTGYVVGDPLSEVGMVTLTGTELKAFFVSWGGTGNAVW